MTYTNQPNELFNLILGCRVEFTKLTGRDPTKLYLGDKESNQLISFFGTLPSQIMGLDLYRVYTAAPHIVCAY